MYSILFNILLLSSVITASPVLNKRDDNSTSTVDNTNYNSTNIQVLSDTQFCSFLPGTPGQDVATTEKQGKPFCTDSSLGGYTFPSGLILTAHYLKTDSYSQVTGTFDPSVYNLSSTDNGGQYDNRDQSQHKCNDLDYFVNLIEPNGGTFCIRCCESQADCNIGISQDGCRKVVPGDYS